MEVVLGETVFFSELGVARVFLEIGTRHFHLGPIANNKLTAKYNLTPYQSC